ncbi:MAG: hypothetical protein BWK76_11310 [Desulfobulbaceae bacterium A2]|nr:MAG: hypothetical protein BWK76_11310 [Desulfobulbaceae bacterium A2]
MATDIELAIMAGRAYQSTRDKINWFPSPEGWTEIEHKTKESGFEAGYFQRGTGADTEIVISFAGTGPEITNPDWVANTELATGLVCASQLKEAAAYYLEVRKKNPNAKITLTGHSLGGGLASLLAVYFDEQAVTFDQAPFANSVKESFRDELFNYLAERFTAEELSLYATDLVLSSSEALSSRLGNVRDVSVQGEILSSLSSFPPVSRIGHPSMLEHGTVVDNLGMQTDLHSQTLLIFLQNADFRKVTYNLPDLLKLVFDTTLFAYSTAPSNTTNVNFLEFLLQHQIGMNGAAGDGMLDRFTTDLWTIAQDGGLSQTNTNIADLLTAFAMEAYYTGRVASDATLFQSMEGGLRFNLAQVTDTLSSAKGYQYLDDYLNTLAYSDAKSALVEQLPQLRDWYIQAGGGSADDHHWRHAA